VGAVIEEWRSDMGVEPAQDRITAPQPADANRRKPCKSAPSVVVMVIGVAALAWVTVG